MIEKCVMGGRSIPGDGRYIPGRASYYGDVLYSEKVIYSGRRAPIGRRKRRMAGAGSRGDLLRKGETHYARSRTNRAAEDTHGGSGEPRSSHPSPPAAAAPPAQQMRARLDWTAYTLYNTSLPYRLDVKVGSIRPRVHLGGTIRLSWSKRTASTRLLN